MEVTPVAPKLTTAIDQISHWLGRAGAILLILSTMVVFTVVILRYAFSSGSIALQESGMWLHSAAFLLAAAWTLRENGHVRVDVLYQGMSKKGKAWVEILGGLFFLLPLCLFMIIVSWRYVMASWSIYESSPETGGLPGLFLLKSLIPLAALSLLLQALAQMARAVSQLRG